MLSHTLIWFIVALITAGAEMLVGTFYLLVVALACAAGGIASWLDVSVSVQLIVCGVVVVLGSLIVRRLRQSNDESEKLQNLDVGQIVTVNEVARDGHAEVSYRGTRWRARAAEGIELSPGIWVIRRINGTELVLGPQSNV